MASLSLGRAKLFAQHPPARLISCRSLHYSVALRAATVLGIRAEDPKRLWERRTPLTPDDVSTLVRGGARVLVQSCEKRIFPDRAYTKAGAHIVESVSPEADVVLGIKEVPIADIAPRTTYAFFSHTHKGQAYNLPLLSAMLASKESRFIDWELLTDDDGNRTTAFGFLAGFSGMADGLTQFATKALARGFATPFLTLPRPYMTPSVDELKQHLRRVGNAISERGTPSQMGPLVVVVSGKGRVGTGAKAVLDELPTVWVKASELERIASDQNTDRRKVYACQLELSDYLEHVDGRPFDRQEYRATPHLFTSTFHRKIAPYTTVLLNGGFWKTGCPRLLSNVQLAELQRTAGRPWAIVDVSCDFDGALEFVKSATTIDDPVIQFDAERNEFHRDASRPGSTQLSSIEILPSELPYDSSVHFSSCVLPYVKTLLADRHLRQDSFEARALRRATIVNNGSLTADHEHLSELLEKRLPARKRVVVLGSGLVAGPAVRVLASRPDIDLILASDNLEQAEEMSAPFDRATATRLDVRDDANLTELVKGADAVLSLLPAPFHAQIARACIANGTHLVTASYISPEIASLGDEARKAGVILLNELGLDPGIDHASAMAMIEEAGKAGKKIESFISFCGGLPSPELSDGPLGYRFSWSPRGVLTAAGNPARFRIDGKQIDIEGKDLLRSALSPISLIRGFAFEGLANRDSTKYIAEYGLAKDIPTIMRGTLRYPAYSRVVDVFQKLGLCSPEALPEALPSWQDLLPQCVSRTLAYDGAKDLRTLLTEVAENDVAADEAYEALQRLGLLATSSREGLPPCPTQPSAPLDLLSTLLAHQLRYEEGERDLVVLHHELLTTSQDGEKELATSTLVQYGVPNGDSAMATTVGVPAAIGVLLCVDGKISQAGLVTPTAAEVWRPLLASLEEHGIRLVERKVKDKAGVLKQVRQQLRKSLQ